ncbi:MAG: sugar transferase, partial [Oscillochloris sp.]|nr:sugar transferase [Oscillochloris sp.]
MDRSLPPPVGSALTVDSPRWASRRSRRMSVFSLMLVDQVLIFIAFAIAYGMRYSAAWPRPLNRIVVEVATSNQVDFPAFLPILVPLMIFLAVRFAARGLYRSSPRISLIEQISIIVGSTLTG